MTAVIPAAGHGTRFLPVTRVIPKEMLPIGAKPALELIVDEVKEAGAEKVVLVISEGKELIRRYFEGRDDIEFVYQREQKGLGHAVLQAADAIDKKEGNVLIALGDALVTGPNASKSMVKFSAEKNNGGVIGLEYVPGEKVSRYGIVKIDRSFRIKDMVEKPSIETAPSRLAVAGRYLLNAAVFDFLRDQKEGVGGEIQLTDAIRRMLEEFPVYGYVYPGHRQDIGNPKGYLQALEAFNEDSQNS